MFHTFTSWHHEPLNETRRIILSKIYEFSLVLFPLICSYVVVFYLSNLWNLTFLKQIKEFVWQSFHLHLDVWLSGIISCMRQANERRHYIVTLSLIGWAHTQIDPWAMGYTEPWVFTDKMSPWHPFRLHHFPFAIWQSAHAMTQAKVCLPQGMLPSKHLIFINYRIHPHIQMMCFLLTITRLRHLCSLPTCWQLPCSPTPSTDNTHPRYRWRPSQLDTWQQLVYHLFITSSLWIPQWPWVSLLVEGKLGFSTQNTS